jgi:hypothetical protein
MNLFRPVASPPAVNPSEPEPPVTAFCEPSVRNWTLAVVFILVVGSWSPRLLPESSPIEFIVLPGAVLGLMALTGLYWSIRADRFLQPARILRYRRLFFFGPLVALVLFFQILILRFPVRRYSGPQTPAA